VGEASLYRHGAVVLYHRGHPQGAAQKPNASIGQRMTVEIVDEKAATCPPLHFSEKLDGVLAVEVVEEKGGVDDVDTVVRDGKLEGVSDLDSHLKTKRGW
jgi:hypothetical protein